MRELTEYWKAALTRTGTLRVCRRKRGRRMSRARLLLHDHEGQSYGSSKRVAYEGLESFRKQAEGKDRVPRSAGQGGIPEAVFPAICAKIYRSNRKFCSPLCGACT